MRSEARFFVRHGKLRLDGDWFAVSCSKAAAKALFSTLAVEFGPVTARQVVQGICLAPFQLPLLLQFGTARRLLRLAEVIEGQGRFLPGSGFFAIGDDLAAVVVRQDEAPMMKEKTA